MRSWHRAAFLAINAAVAALGSGCLLDSSAFEAAGAGAASGTTTGSGGAATTSTTTVPGSGGSGGAAAGGAGGTGGAGGGGTGGAGGGSTTTSPACMEDVDCPDDVSSCLGPKCDKATGTCTTKNTNEGGVCGVAMSICHDVARCKAGACESKPLPKDTVVDDEKSGDCQKNVCDGLGAVTSKEDGSDTPDSTSCADKSCDHGEVVAAPKNEGGQCLLGAGKCCAGQCCDPFTCLLCTP